MPQKKTTRVDWVARDTRQWVALETEPDHVTARMVRTMLQANGLDARVASHGGAYCLEVPEDSFEMAMEVRGGQAEGTPAMQEQRVVTGTRTKQLIKDNFAKTDRVRKRELTTLAVWLIRVAALAIAATLAWLLLS